MTLIGEIHYPEILNYYCLGDLFVFTSLTETQGMVLAEAKAAGLLEFGTDLQNPDFSKVAEACGLLGLRASKPEEVKEKIFKNISSRAADMIKEDLEVMGPVRLSDVEKAQGEIIKIVRKMEEEGKIVLAGRGSEDVLV